MHSHREGFYPVMAPQPDLGWKGKLSALQWAEVTQKRGGRSLRQVAGEYGVSHETVRRTLRLADEMVARKVR